MIPFCLIVGDSTGLGTAEALAAQGLRCEIHARVGARSAEPLQTWRGGSPAGVALIALGSNDPTNPALAKNLLAVRRRVFASRVTWLAPYSASAARVVVSLARSLGDAVVQLAGYSSRDRLHPASYRQVALSLGWRNTGAIPNDIPVKHEALAPVIPASIRPTRKATVIVFD